MPSGPNRDSQLATHSTPRPAALCVPALAARFPRAFRRVLRALSSCALSRPPRFRLCAAPLTPPLSRRPPPLQRVLSAAPVRAPAATASFCVFRVAPCFCDVLLRRPLSRPTLPRAPPRAAPRQAPFRTRVTSRCFAAGVTALLLARVRLALLLLCVALADSLLAHSPARAHPDASPRTPRTDRPLTFGTSARFLCASHGFLRALCTAGALLWSDCLAYDLSFAVALMLCAAWLFLQRRLCAHLPHWRVLCWRLCAECFLLPRDGLHCRWIKRAAAMLLECVNAGWKRDIWSCEWCRHLSSII